MAAWRSMSDDEYDVCESHGRDVRVTDDYDWDGDLDRELASPAFHVLTDPVNRIVLVMDNAA